MLQYPVYIFDIVVFYTPSKRQKGEVFMQPRNKRIAAYLSFMMITGIALFSCNNNSNSNEHTATLSYSTSNDIIEIKSSAVGSEKYDDIYIFKTALSKSENIPYIDIGTEITINFDTVPLEYELTDSILEDDGAVMWGNKGLLDVEVNKEDETHSFILETNILPYLSSEMRYSDSDRVYRGFRLECTWQDEYKVFYFVLKSKAR